MGPSVHLSTSCILQLWLVLRVMLYKFEGSASRGPYQSVRFLRVKRFFPFFLNSSGKNTRKIFDFSGKLKFWFWLQTGSRVNVKIRVIRSNYSKIFYYSGMSHLWNMIRKSKKKSKKRKLHFVIGPDHVKGVPMSGLRFFQLIFHPTNSATLIPNLFSKSFYRHPFAR